jgi:hypothetical protein
MARRRGLKQYAWPVRIIIAFGPSLWLLLKQAPLWVVAPVAALGFFLFVLPRACRATTSDGRLCTNNANGILGGCHFRAHKKQNSWRLLPMSWRPPSARPDLIQVRRRREVPVGSPPPDPVPRSDPGLWGTPAAALTTIGTIVSAVSMVVSVLAWQLPVK